MIVHGFDMQRVFLATPGSLTSVQDACRAAISEANEREGLPRKILLEEIGLREAQLRAFGAGAEQNVRECSYFIAVLEGPSDDLRRLLDLAIECRDDGGKPMREVVVFVNESKADRGARETRVEFEAMSGLRVFSYASEESLKSQVGELTSGWLREHRDGKS